MPLKDASLAAWEILLSESQERMLVAVPPDKLAEALAILTATTSRPPVGEFTGTRRYEAYWRRERVVDLDMAFLWGACPIDAAEMREPASASWRRPRRRRTSTLCRPMPSRVLAHYHCCDQSPAGFQFDSTVQGRTVVGPYGGRTGRMPTGAFVSAPLRGRNGRRGEHGRLQPVLRRA